MQKGTELIALRLNGLLRNLETHEALTVVSGFYDTFI